MSGELRPQYPILVDGEQIPTFAQLIDGVLKAKDPDQMDGPLRVDFVPPYPGNVTPIAICTSRNAGYGLRAVAISSGRNEDNNKPPRQGLYIVTKNPRGEPVVLKSESEPSIWNQRDSYYLTSPMLARRFYASDPNLGTKLIERFITEGVEVRHIPDGMGLPARIATAFPDLFTPFQRD